MSRNLKHIYKNYKILKNKQNVAMFNTLQHFLKYIKMYQKFYDNLKYIGSLLFYEVPFLYVARHQITNEYYLLFELCIGDDNDSYKWLIFKTSIEVLKQFIEKEFTFFELSKKRLECEYTGKFGLTADINCKWCNGEQIREVRNVQLQTTIDGVYGHEYFEGDCADSDVINLIKNL